MELIISQPCSEMLHRVKLYPAQFFPVFKENDLKKKKTRMTFTFVISTPQTLSNYVCNV